MFKTCSFQGCSRPHACKGLCAAHYRQHQLGKPLTELKERATYVSPKCSVEGCDKPNKARGYCMTHYQQWSSGRIVRLVQKRTRGASLICQLEGCDRPQKSRGWCASHYQQWRRGVTPASLQTRDRNGPAVCTEEGCGQLTKARGLCQLHYARLREHGYTHYTERSKEPKPCAVPGCHNWLWAKGLCHLHYIRIRRAKKYGLTPETYLERLEKSGNLCELCGHAENMLEPRTGKVRTLAIDHCHVTMTVRGFLCGNCNRGLGFFNDDPDLLVKAAMYIKTHRGAK